MNKIYTGIGSRQTPENILGKIELIAEQLAKKGWTLRSGGADGADTAFEKGCDKGKGKKEIYLPWKGFNGNKSELYHINPDAYKLVEQFHPAYKWLKPAVKNLHGRNIQQILSYDLETPASFVMAWTKKGQEIGGTATAIKLAKDRNIRIFNLAIEEFDWNYIK
jgi:hypothetical protein